MKRILTLIAATVILPLFCFSQEKSLRVQEDSLRILSSLVAMEQDDSLKLHYNIRYKERLIQVLNDPSTFKYPFDSLKNLGKVMSPDERFRLYNWNVPLQNGTNRYFCIIQIREGKRSVRLIDLNDLSDSVTEPEKKVLGKANWFGALYYKIIPQKSGQREIYTLLGWDGYSTDKSRKLIEVISFNQKGDPVFGATIFRNYQGGRNTRIFLDYPAEASLLLKYDEQIVTTGRKWNASKRRFETSEEKRQMILFDHLTPVESTRTETSMTSSDIFDGLVFENGTWNFISGIDPRNP